MTPYIKNQLIKLCDHPEWFIDMFISLDNNPEEPHTAIHNYLSHVQLNGLLENTEIVPVSLNGDEPKPGFYFGIPKDPNMYLIVGILDEDECPRTVLFWVNQSSTNTMEPIITINEYPIEWEWLDRVSLEDFNFSTMTDNTDTYDFVGYTDSETLPGQQRVFSEREYMNQYTDMRIPTNEIEPC